MKSSAAATANVAASTKNGSEKATAMMNPPSTGPRREFMTISPPHSRPLAFSSISFSTIDGISVWAALSLSTSANPKSSAEE